MIVNRTHYAIKAKRTLGYWIDGEKALTRMHNNLINARGGSKFEPSPMQNMMVTLCTVDRRRMMTARRILHRLGLIEERADTHEKHLWL